MANISMADLLAKQDKKQLRLSRNQEIEGEVVSINPQEIILDLGTKSEGVLPKRDLSQDQLSNLKVGDKLSVFVVIPENESGQVLLTLHKSVAKGPNTGKWRRFEEALRDHQTMLGKGLEVNKGGLIVEVNGVRGFLPSSQVSLSTASNLDELVGKEVQVSVIEVDPNQNRLIFTQKGSISEDVKEKITKLKIGDQVKGAIAAVLPFGIFVTISGENFEGVEGLVHVSELSWDRVEDPAAHFKVGQEVEAKVVSIDHETGRVNLSIKQLTEDPFMKKTEGYKSDDVIKGKVSKVNNMGIYVSLEDGLEGLIQSSKLEPGEEYKEGQEITVLIDTVEKNKRRILLSPFRTSTKGLIYK